MVNLSAFGEKIYMKKTGVCNHTVVTIHAEEFLNHLESLKYSPKSIKTFRYGLQRFNVFLTSRQITRIQDVTIKDLDSYRLELINQDYSDQSIGLYLRSVRKLFKYLEETRQIFINPASKLIIPSLKKEIKPVPDESQMITLIEQPDISKSTGIRDRAIIETFYRTGIRLEELILMDISDVDFINKCVSVIGKGNKQRVVPIGQQAVYWIDRYLIDVRPVFLRNKADNGALWLGFKGSRIHPLMVERFISDYGKKAKIHFPVTPHCIRRACATHMLRAGAHPVNLQMLLGHSNLSVLSHYLKITITDMKAMHEKGNPGK